MAHAPPSEPGTAGRHSWAPCFSHAEGMGRRPLPSLALSPCGPRGRASVGGLSDTTVLCPQDPAQLPSFLSAALTLGGGAATTAPGPWAGVNTAVTSKAGPPPLLGCEQVCPPSRSALHTSSAMSLRQTRFAGTSQGLFLGLQHGAQLLTREAGRKLSTATPHKGVWRPRERFWDLPNVSPAPGEPKVKSRVSVPRFHVEGKEKEDNFSVPSPQLLLGLWAEGE